MVLGVEDYPRTLTELEARLGTEQACRNYLLKLRWPEGFVCPRCGARSAWTTNRNLLVCAGCQYQGSLTAGTIFQDTRKPLTLWFRAIWWVTTQKNGASALGLQRILGLGSYVTAWTWLHKLRRAMVRPGRDRLGGRVEVDETYVGGLEEGVRSRQTETKALVAIACEEDGRGVGRIRLRSLIVSIRSDAISVSLPSVVTILVTLARADAVAVSVAQVSSSLLSSSRSDAVSVSTAMVSSVVQTAAATHDQRISKPPSEPRSGTVAETRSSVASGGRSKTVGKE